MVISRRRTWSSQLKSLILAISLIITMGLVLSEPYLSYDYDYHYMYID